MTRLTGSLLVLGVALPLCAGEIDLRPRVKAAAQEIASAYLREDFGKYVAYTNPKVLQRLGGRDKMIGVLQTTVADMKAKGFRVKSYTVGEPGEVVGEGSERFAIVPTVTVMAVPKAVMTLKTFLVAASSDGGQSWSFIDGTETTEQEIRQLLPNLPPEVRLPRKQAPVVEKGP